MDQLTLAPPRPAATPLASGRGISINQTLFTLQRKGNYLFYSSIGCILYQLKTNYEVDTRPTGTIGHFSGYGPEKRSEKKCYSNCS